MKYIISASDIKSGFVYDTWTVSSQQPLSKFQAKGYLREVLNEDIDGLRISVEAVPETPIEEIPNFIFKDFPSDEDIKSCQAEYNTLGDKIKQKEKAASFEKIEEGIGGIHKTERWHELQTEIKTLQDRFDFLDDFLYKLYKHS